MLLASTKLEHPSPGTPGIRLGPEQNQGCLTFWEWFSSLPTGRGSPLSHQSVGWLQGWA